MQADLQAFVAARINSFASAAWSSGASGVARSFASAARSSSAALVAWIFAATAWAFEELATLLASARIFATAARSSSATLVAWIFASAGWSSATTVVAANRTAGPFNAQLWKAALNSLEKILQRLLAWLAARYFSSAGWLASAAWSSGAASVARSFASAAWSAKKLAALVATIVTTRSQFTTARRIGDCSVAAARVAAASTTTQHTAE